MKKINLKGSNYETARGYSKFVKLKLNGKEENPNLHMIINNFGVSREDRLAKKVKCGIVEKKDCLWFYTKAPEIKSTRGFICGMPTARIGKSIWGQDSGFTIGQVKDYSKMRISTDWNFNIKNGFSEFMYNVWLTEKSTGPLTMNGMEIMIVLDKNFDIPWKDLGKFQGFNVRYRKKDFTRDKGHTFAFLLKDKVKSFDFELLDFISYCMKHIKKKGDDYHIRSIDWGIEFASKTEAELKLKKIKFDFVRKK